MIKIKCVIARLILGINRQMDAEYLDVCRKKRNIIEYDYIGVLQTTIYFLVEQTGFEPATYTLRTCRSPS